MSVPVNEQALDTIFRQARTYNEWLPRSVSEDVLRGVYELTKLGPTSANTCPMHVVFVRSEEAKARLKPALAPGNVEKTMAAPVCAIVADDMLFYENTPKLFPQYPQFAELFTKPGQEEFTRAHAFRNATLQGAYLLIAARSVGLDTGPMSGFDNAMVDAEFFSGGRYKSNFLINLGYGDAGKLAPRNPRLTFAEACEIL